MPTQQRTDEALRVAEMTRLALLAMRQETGSDLAIVLAGAHAEIATAMALAFGREVAIQQCEAAAERLRSLPGRDELIFAATPSAGRA